MSVLYDATVASSPTSFNQQQPTSQTQTQEQAQQTTSPNTRNNAFLISIQVISSSLVVLVLLFCFATGLYKKKRALLSRQRMIDNAIRQQEIRIQLHLQGQCHSASTTVTTLIQCPLPSYAPPDPRHSLPKDVVARLDCLLEQNQICSTTRTTNTPTTTIRETLPSYTHVCSNN